MELDKNNSSSGRDLIRTVATENLGDTMFDVAEVLLDQNLKDGAFKDLPVISIFAKLARAKKSVSEELFIRKLVRFLSDLNSVSIQDREKLLNKYPDSSEEQKILGENILLAIERLDDINKPIIFARIFSAYIKSNIDYVTFTRLSRALEKFNLELLPNLRWYYTREDPVAVTPEEIIHELSLAGLVTAWLHGSGALGGSARYVQSDIGKVFLRIGFNVQV